MKADGPILLLIYAAILAFIWTVDDHRRPCYEATSLPWLKC